MLYLLFAYNINFLRAFASFTHIENIQTKIIYIELNAIKERCSPEQIRVLKFPTTFHFSCQVCNVLLLANQNEKKNESKKGNDICTRITTRKERQIQRFSLT